MSKKGLQVGRACLGGVYMPNPKFPYPKRDILRITLVYFEDILGMSGGYVWTMDILGLS